MSNPEAELRALWTAQGVPPERQEQLIRDIVAKATPAAIAAMFPPATELTPIGEQFVIPGCERKNVAGPRQPRQATLWD